MKVKDLIEALSSLDQDAEVILAKDPEGNGYSPLSRVDSEAVYVPITTWHGEVYSTTWSADDAGLTKREWRAIKAKPRCVVFEPLA